MEDLRCTVQSLLQSQLEDSNGFLPRESWIRFLRDISGTEQEAAEAVLQEIPDARMSVKHFLDILFCPKDAMSAEVFTAQESDSTTTTNNLKEYFETHYRVGGEFCNSDYEMFGDYADFTWTHKPTGIQVWRDAVDLTSGGGGQVFFHYTSELAFGNITHPSKKAAEILASLRTEGPNANAWWGKGIYTVPYPPDGWQSREELLDNNFRNMMQRDRDSEDPEKGPEYVDREYPKRAAFCVPILIDPVNAFDVSTRATPEMVLAGKEPGRNLGDKLLNEPGKPPRCCVVLRVSGEDGVKHARGQLLHTLRQRVHLAPLDLDAKRRLTLTLKMRGFYQEALPMEEGMVAFCESTYGPESLPALKCSRDLAGTLVQMGDEWEAEKINRRVVDAMAKTLGPEHKETLDAMSNLALNLYRLRNDHEAIGLYYQVIASSEKCLGPSHRDTLRTVTNLAIALQDMHLEGLHPSGLSEAIGLYRRALDAREKTLGPEHPETLQSVSNLAVALHKSGDLSEALALQRRALEARDRLLGPQHPSTKRSLQRLGSVLGDIDGEEVPGGIVELCCELVAGRIKMLGPRHPDTVAAKAVLALSLRPEPGIAP